MRKGVAALVGAVALVAVGAVLAAVLIDRSQRKAEPSLEPSSQPAWVTQAVASMRKMFVGNPEPKSVRYHQGRKSASVTIRFSDLAVCGVCERPAGAPLPLGRVATLALDTRTHHTLGFSFGG